METTELLKRVEQLVEENENLKLKNLELSKQVGKIENWTGIREQELIPRLEARYGNGRCMFTHIINPIGSITRELLSVNRLSEINKNNFELAKEIAISVLEVICKYDWPNLKEHQELWKKNWGKING